MQYVPFLAILAAYALIYLPRMGPVAKAMNAMPGGYDNHDPRTQLAQLEGAGRRAANAHQNAIEAFAPFAAGVIVAMLRTPAHPDLISLICIGFVVVRTVYMFAYIADKPSLRSGMWSLGLLATAALMVFGVIGPTL
ncbi:MAG: MAPEG family protein [Kofleriaceae bacterium]